MSKSMLDFSRKREKKREVCTVEELIVEAIRFVQPRFAKPERPVDVNIQPDCPEIHVEKWRIVHALVNLLNNASDAVDGCLTRIVTLSARSEGGFIFLSVSDTGNGIPPEIVDRVFHPFFTTKGERGNGLGLYITRLTVEEHCGTITLQTNENGTTFTMCLPVQEGTTSMQ
jgi:two-component system C4-dicarboxylate transport sensor histidine kinase DctB